MARYAGQFEPLAMRLENLQRRASDATCGSQDGDFVGPIHALGSDAVQETLVAVFEQPALPIDRPWVMRSCMIGPTQVDPRKWPAGITWIYYEDFRGSEGIPQRQTLPRRYPVCIITGGISSRRGLGSFFSLSP